MIDAILSIVLYDEDRQVLPIPGVRQRFDDLAYRKIVVGNHRLGLRKSWVGAGGVVARKSCDYQVWHDARFVPFVNIGKQKTSSNHVRYHG